MWMGQRSILHHQAGMVLKKPSSKGWVKLSPKGRKIYINYFTSSDPHNGIQFIPSDILSGISSGLLSGISSDILSGISSDILSGISFDILSGISSDILSGISSDILSGILFGILFGILYGFVSGRWGPVEVRRGPRRAESRRLRCARPTVLRISPGAPTRRLRSGEAHSASTRRLRCGEAHCAQTLAGWGPARPTAIKSWQRRSGEAQWRST